MRIHGLMTVRDEDDILEQNLRASLEWIDTIHVYDTGSTDLSWDIVQDFAKRDARVVPVRRESTVFNEALRGILFEQARRSAADGDWFLRLDADEFYERSPRQFLTREIRSHETCVYLQWYFFRLTSREVRDWECGVEGLPDRQRPIIERRRFFTVPSYAEPRLFRYRKTMRWPSAASFPRNAGYIARKRIPIRHYPHRDPVQLEKRMRIRARMFELGGSATTNAHWRVEDWRQQVVEVPEDGRTDIVLPRGDVPGLNEGELHCATPGQPLPEVFHLNHLAPPRKRLAQRLAHRFLLPILDARRAQD